MAMHCTERALWAFLQVVVVLLRNAELLCRAEGMLLVSLQELTFLFGVFLIRAK